MLPNETELRQRLLQLMQGNPQIHVDVMLQKPKLMLKNAPATIMGVYSHTFLLEESSEGYVRRHSLQYTDVLLGYIVIRELEADV